jgi:hypothetical protein
MGAGTAFAILFVVILLLLLAYWVFRCYQQKQAGEWDSFDDLATLQEQNVKSFLSGSSSARHDQGGFTGSQQGYVPPVHADGSAVGGATPWQQPAPREKANKQMLMTQKYEAVHSKEDQILEGLINSLAEQQLLISFSDLKIETEVGRGVSSIVYSGVYSRGQGQKDETVAIKILHERVTANEHAADLFKEFFEREIAVLCKIQHANVLNLYGLAAHRGCLHIVTDYYPLTLDVITRGQGGGQEAEGGNVIWSEELIMSLSVQLAKGMEHLHGANIVHRDLKPANCLLTLDGTKLVLADFGLSKVLNEYYCSMTGQIGSPAFMANEMINDSLSNKVSPLYLPPLPPPVPPLNCLL